MVHIEIVMLPPTSTSTMIIIVVMPAPASSETSSGGTAMRCMIAEPVPVLHMIGSRPAMVATTVIIFGRTRSTAPSMMAS